VAGIFSSRTYDAIASDLRDALAWFRSLGVEHERTRIGEYQRAVQLLVAAYRDARTDVLQREFPRINNALVEGHDIVYIHRPLAGRFDSELERHIKAYASGPVIYTDEKAESASNRARNIGLELGVMAALARAELPIDFSIPTDVACEFGNRTLLFECKRPQSPDSVKPRVKDAFRQLEQKYQTAQRTRYRGIITLDITKVLNPSFKLYVTDDRISIDQIMSHLVDRFLIDHRSSWELRRTSKTIGILVRLRQMSVVEGASTSKLFYGQQFALTPISHVGVVNAAIAEDLASSIGQSIEHAV